MPNHNQIVTESNNNLINNNNTNTPDGNNGIVYNNLIATENYQINTINENTDSTTNYNIPLINNVLHNNTQTNDDNNTTYNNITKNYNSNKNYNTNNNNIAAKELNILTVKSLYHITLANEFYNDPRFLQPIAHAQNTRRRAEGRFQEGRFHNEYGRKTLDVTLPKIFNNLPISIINTKNTRKRNTMLKHHFLNLQ